MTVAGSGAMRFVDRSNDLAAVMMIQSCRTPIDVRRVFTTMVNAAIDREIQECGDQQHEA
jgi:hypothetical protein